mgnify:CR=1 FL=1
MKKTVTLSIGTRVAWVVGLLGAGYLAGRVDDTGQRAYAEVRQTPRREAFEAGDQRSEAVLKEIATTLKTMDARIARIEKTVTTFPKPTDQ